MYICIVCLYTSRDGCGALVPCLGARAFIHGAIDRPIARSNRRLRCERSMKTTDSSIDRSIDRSRRSSRSMDARTRARPSSRTRSVASSIHHAIHAIDEWMAFSVTLSPHPGLFHAIFMHPVGRPRCLSSMTIDRFSSITFIDVSRCSSITIDRCRDDDDDDDDDEDGGGGGDGSGCRVDRSCAWDRDEG